MREHNRESEEQNQYYSDLAEYGLKLCLLRVGLQHYFTRTSDSIYPNEMPSSINEGNIILPQASRVKESAMLLEGSVDMHR